MQKVLSYLLVLALFAGLAVITPSLIRADDSTTATGTITGKVIDASGNPVPGAKVSARLTKRVAGAPRLTATTADDGTFAINDVPAGSYNIMVRDKTAGKGKSDTAVKVAAGATADAGTITLTPPNTDNGGGNGGGNTGGATNGGAAPTQPPN
ncbi:MAG TPA: carboxypeptidase-like regulatory domain-containing protein [Phycisphaerae bacterium]|nr:carboxypeptidase-like regulatory domain-containing protein [Phycisphaerae bacterium]